MRQWRSQQAADAERANALQARVSALHQLAVIGRDTNPLEDPAALRRLLDQLGDIVGAGRLEFTPDADETATAVPGSVVVRLGDRRLGILIAATASAASADVELLDATAAQLAVILEHGRLRDQLRDATGIDHLTGLANLDRLRTFVDAAFTEAEGGVLLLLDIDRFHDVNDMLGHEAGDAILAEVARRLQVSPAPGSLVARIAADQFAVATPGPVGSEVARLGAMAVKSRVEGSIRFADLNADIRISVGIARCPDHGAEAAVLLRRAERAMTAATGSTSGIGEWEPGEERDGSRRLQILTALREALGDSSLHLAYQPKMSLRTAEVIGFEALARWNHPTLGSLDPSEFIPLAEATGLISTLTTGVLRAALTACRTWHDIGKPVGVAVNISARSLDNPTLVGQVAALLAASGLDARWLTLEITESSLMANLARSLEVLEKFRALGVRLSIDDFGTGYSSLHQVRGLPIHEVKIDQAFVQAVDTDLADRAVVHAIVGLCGSLGLATVAEGVERASQATTLGTLGVDQGQGYYFARPLTAAAALEWLSSHNVTSLATY